MKKKMIGVAALFVAACMAIGCAKTNSGEKAGESSATSEAEIISSIETQETSNIESNVSEVAEDFETSAFSDAGFEDDAEDKPDEEKDISSDEIDEKFVGEYMNASFLKEFSEKADVTKVNAYDVIIVVYFDENMSDYYLVQGNSHEGNASRKLLSAKYNSDENKYILNFEEYREGFPTVLEYYIAEDRYEYMGYGGIEQFSGEVKLFKDGYGYSYYMAYSLLKDSPDVIVKNGKIYVTIAGEEKVVAISADSFFDGLQATKLADTEPCGKVYFEMPTDETSHQWGYYYIEDNSFVAKDGDANVIVKLAL